MRREVEAAGKQRRVFEAGPWGTKRARAWLVWALGAWVLVLVATLGCEPKSKSAGLLESARIHQSEGVTNAARIADGLAPPAGSGWQTNRAATFSSTRAFVTYDLGAERKIGSIAILADNNDEYELLGSRDGKDFSAIWRAPRVGPSGMRWRSKDGVTETARYVRLRAASGDRSLSVGELIVSEAPATDLGSVQTVRAFEGMLEYRSALLVAATFLLLLVALHAAGASLVVNAGLGLVALYGVYTAFTTWFELAPVGMLEVSLTRAVAATLALGVVLRETYSQKGHRPIAAVNVGVLSLAAVLAVASFFNLGRPQFYDAKQGEPSVVHNFDMRVYYPVAKYFEELKYDGLYLASTLSYAEEHGGLETSELRRTELRDLRDHRMRRASEIEPEILAIRARFSDARWAEFKRDMAYFWETMGPAYLGSMRDHGGNATPLWLAIAHLMFRSTTASNEVLLWAGALDPLLLLLFGVCAWRAFGVRTALVALVVFGANDFYMFGSNWAGATLRNDWMVYLGLGACALKVGRYGLGGALLAFSAMIRAFPAITLFALGIPVLYYVIDVWRAERKLPSFSRLYEDERWFFQAAMGASLFVAGSVLFSSLVLGGQAWPLWVQKISSFTASPHVNHIGLLTFTSGSEHNQLEVNLQRIPLHVGLSVLYLALALWAARGRRPHVVALLGILLMPVFMYPANYYIHFVFLLVLLVDEPLLQSGRFEREASGKVWILLLGLCAAQYFTVKEQSLDLHFYNAAVLLMATLLGVLVALLPRDEAGLVVLPFGGRFLPAAPDEGAFESVASTDAPSDGATGGSGGEDAFVDAAQAMAAARAVNVESALGAEASEAEASEAEESALSGGNVPAEPNRPPE